jgi:glycosyltransferase involved in cell wall biosynthesis
VREIVNLGEHPQISITGFVPDIRPYIQKAAIAVAPLAYGVGIQNKVLEALACGEPTITTSQAARSFAAAKNHQLLVADGPAAFASQILHLLDNPEHRRALGLATSVRG